MSVHTILSPSQTFSLLSPVNATASPIRATIPSLSSSISGLSLNLPRYSPNLSTSAARKLLTVVSGSKKAVSVLKGNSNVEGVVTLTQEDDGQTTVKVRVAGLTPGHHWLHLGWQRQQSLTTRDTIIEWTKLGCWKSLRGP